MPVRASHPVLRHSGGPTRPRKQYAAKGSADHGLRGGSHAQAIRSPIPGGLDAGGRGATEHADISSVLYMVRAAGRLAGAFRMT